MFKRVYKCLIKHEAEYMQFAEDETQVEHRLVIRGAHDNWDDKSFKFSEKTTNSVLPVGHYSMIEDPDGVADIVTSWERERGIHWDNGAAKK